ncbi:MAG: IMP cyclohydrolase [Methanocellales archaeon]|nr:IMP cyclohydrolase [Methanocellales archaeon]
MCNSCKPKAYVGRMVAIGKSDGKPFVGYRVSSRSFPNRIAVAKGDIATITPKDSADVSKSPYISYNCIRVIGERAIATNGSHTDVIAEKIQQGYPPRDAIALGLLTMDYEKDAYNTPRIAGIIDVTGLGYLGIIQASGMNIRGFKPEDGAFFVATYEKTDFEKLKLHGSTAQEIAQSMYELEFEHPVCATAALWDGAFEIGVYNG